MDKRNTVDYTFTGTGEEAFDHNFGRKPIGYQVISKDTAGVVYGDIENFTDRKAYLSCSIAGTRVRLLLL